VISKVQVLSCAFFCRNTEGVQTHDRLIIKPIVKRFLDHELSLAIKATFEDYLRRKDWAFLVANPKGGKHLFLNDLSNFNKKDAITFDQFAENLRNLKPELILRKEAEQLIEYNIETHDYPLKNAYLKKKNQKNILNKR
jgi:hypothetical protein